MDIISILNWHNYFHIVSSVFHRLCKYVKFQNHTISLFLVKLRGDFHYTQSQACILSGGSRSGCRSPPPPYKKKQYKIKDTFLIITAIMGGAWGPPLAYGLLCNSWYRLHASYQYHGANQTWEIGRVSRKTRRYVGKREKKNHYGIWKAVECNMFR